MVVSDSLLRLHIEAQDDVPLMSYNISIQNIFITTTNNWHIPDTSIRQNNKNKQVFKSRRSRKLVLQCDCRHTCASAHVLLYFNVIFTYFTGL